MATLQENAIRITNAFNNIKEAILRKGQTPSGDVTTYADAISKIQSGGAGDGTIEWAYCTTTATSSTKVELQSLYHVSDKFELSSDKKSLVCKEDGNYSLIATTYRGYSSTTTNKATGKIYLDNTVKTTGTVASATINYACADNIPIKQGQEVSVYLNTTTSSIPAYCYLIISEVSK